MSRRSHLSVEAIAGFPSLPQGERLSLVMHIQGCRTCGAAFLETWHLLPPAASATSRVVSFSTVLERVAQAEERLTSERQQAPDLERELLQHPQPRRLTLVRNSRRFCTWGLCEHLLVGSKDAVFHKPEDAVSLAEVAQEIADRLDIVVYGEAVTHDFRARSWATLGNALAVVSDLHRADEAFQRACEELALGTGDPIRKAEVAYYRGGLRGAQRRFAESVADFDAAISIYERIGDHHLQAKGLIGKGLALSKAGDPAASVELQKRALPLIDAVREPRVLLAAQHNLVFELVNCGRTAEALSLIDAVRTLHKEAGEQVNQLRLGWVEGQLLHQLGDLEGAERALSSVRQSFSSLGMPYDVALVSLELAMVYAKQDRTVEIKHLALEMLPVFQALEIQRETIAALLLFRQAAEAETASLALIQHIAGFLKRAQHDPSAVFAPPA